MFQAILKAKGGSKHTPSASGSSKSLPCRNAVRMSATRGLHRLRAANDTSSLTIGAVVVFASKFVNHDKRESLNPRSVNRHFASCPRTFHFITAFVSTGLLGASARLMNVIAGPSRPSRNLAASLLMACRMISAYWCCSGSLMSDQSHRPIER